jgi:hypothetical protein
LHAAALIYGAQVARRKLGTPDTGTDIDPDIEFFVQLPKIVIDHTKIGNGPFLPVILKSHTFSAYAACLARHECLVMAFYLHSRVWLSYLIHGIFEKCLYGCLICLNTEEKRIVEWFHLKSIAPMVPDEEANHDSDVQRMWETVPG